MAWDVVISGGGFGGLYAARKLERTMPRHSTRITLVNDVNFMLYTAFLPEAAAGTLEPRHVVTPLRDVLEQTRLILGATVGRDPARRTVTVRGVEGDEHELRYDRLLVAHGSVSRVLPVPGLREHAVGFKTLADAIWLRNHVFSRSSWPTPARTRPSATSSSPSSSWAAAMPGSRRSPSSRTSPRTRSSCIPGPASTACAGCWSRSPTASSRRSTSSWPSTRSSSSAAAESTSASAPRSRRSAAGSTRLSTGETIPTRTVVWTAGVTPHPSTRGLALPLDERRRIRVDEQLRVEGEQDVWAIGDAAAVPDPARPGFPCPPTSQHAIRQGRTAGRNIAASLGSGTAKPFTYKTLGQFANLGRYKAVAKIGPVKMRGFPAWWLARTYHVSQLPSTSRKVRAVMDWTVGLPFGRDIAEVGSIGHPTPLQPEPELSPAPAAGAARPAERGDT